MDKAYLYDGFEARHYDILDELSDFEDVDFYKWFVEANPGSTLDLGCGTGRILESLADCGVELSGLDFSEEMLELCRTKLEAKNVEANLVCGDLREFEFEEKFASILIPGFTIQMLTEEKDVLACLDCCKRHLKPGGQLILSFHIPWEMIEDSSDTGPMEVRCERKDPESGDLFVAKQAWALNREAQTLDLDNRYERYRGEEKELIAVEEKEMTLRWYLPYDAMGLLRAVGFESMDIKTDFCLGEPEEEMECFALIAYL